MNTSLLRTATAAFALTGIISMSFAAPARADGAATTRTIIGIAAAAVGIATAVNVENKHREANQVVGYLQDGSTVYADGHVVSQNGYSWYPSSQGEQVACNGQSCSVYSNGQNGYGYNNGSYNNGNYNNGGYYNNGSYNNGSTNTGGYYNGYGYTPYSQQQQQQQVQQPRHRRWPAQ
jgi:hypothetical protein